MNTELYLLFAGLFIAILAGVVIVIKALKKEDIDIDVKIFNVKIKTSSKEKV